MSDLKDIVNVVTDVFTICAANESEAMPAAAAALPRDTDVFATTGWVAEPQTMVLRLEFPRAHPTWFASDPDVLRLGFRWTYGGRVDGQGAFLKDAEAFVIVDEVAATCRYDVSVRFSPTGTPIGPEPVAMLTATINVRVSQSLVGIRFSQVLGARLFGSGAGDLRMLG